MKVLILSCNTGQGHNSAGKAILEELQRREIPCEMTDNLALAGIGVSKTVSGGYVSIVRNTPRFFGFLYKAANAISSSKHKSVIYGANRLYMDKVYDYIVDNGFDTVVMPHLFPAEVLTALKRSRGLQVRTLAVATDYTCIPFWEETEPDYFVIPHAHFLDEFAGKGIPRDKLLPFGIPVSRCFREKTEKCQARRALGLPEDKPALLIMSGSMGFGNLDRLTDGLLQRYGGDVSIVILGGSNEKSKAKLRHSYAAHQSVYVIDFTTQVSLYMDACDLLFTKPGGLTSTEAVVKNIPAVFTAPIPGCETQNARYFEQGGMALVAQKTDGQLKAVEKLLTDRAFCERMLEAQRAGVNPRAAEDICDFLEQGEQHD